MSEYLPDRMLDRMPESMPGKMPDRMPERMSEYMPESMSDQVICQIECQIECQKECQSTCQKECHSISLFDGVTNKWRMLVSPLSHGHFSFARVCACVVSAWVQPGQETERVKGKPSWLPQNLQAQEPGPSSGEFKEHLSLNRSLIIFTLSWFVI